MGAPLLNGVETSREGHWMPRNRRTPNHRAVSSARALYDDADKGRDPAGAVMCSAVARSR